MMKRRAIGVFFACAAAAWAAGHSGFGSGTQHGVAAGNPHSFELRPDHAQVAAGGSVAIDVLANDSATGDTLVLMALSQPDQGTVQVVDGVPVYTAPADARGSAVFQYRAKPRRGGPPRYGQVTIDIGSLVSIRGQVVRAVGQTGPVTVDLRVGTQTVSTTATEDGRYALDFFAFDDAPIAVLEAHGAAGAQPALHLQSYLGSVGRIQQLAGNDGVLERNESNAVTVSFLSTAQLVHASAANGGLPTSDRAFEAGVLGSDQSSILWTADFLNLVDSGAYSLPATTDPLAYVSVPGGVSRNWSDQGVAVNYPYPALDQRQVVQVQAGAYDARMVLLGEAVERATRDGIRAVSIHEFDASGHRFVDGYARPAIALQPGQDEEGRLTFTPDADFVLREGTVRVSRGTTRQLRRLVERKWVKLFDGEQADQIFQQDMIALVHPDRPQLDRTTFQYTMWVAYEQLPVLPYGNDEVTGRLGLGVYCPRPTLLSGFAYCDYQVHAFDAAGNGGIEAMGASLDGAGQPATQPAGETFQWTLTEAGAISTRRGAVETTYTRISHENAAASGVIAEGQLLVGGVVKRIAHYQAALRLPSTAPTIAAADLEGRWEPGVIHHAPLDLFSMTVWTFDFNIGGNGSEKLTDAWLSNNDYRFAWSSDNDAVMLRKYPVEPYYDGDQLVLSDGHCSGDDGACPVKFQRWKPLAAADGTYYFVEEVYESSLFPNLPLVRTAVAPLSLHRN